MLTPAHNPPSAPTFALEFPVSIFFQTIFSFSYAPILSSPSAWKEEDCETWSIFSHGSAGDAGFYRDIQQGLERTRHSLPNPAVLSPASKA